MIEAPTPCDAHVDLATLSGWRDRAVATTEYRRLTSHIAACSACQYRLRALDHTGQLLQSPDTDEYQERIWRGLQGRMRRPAAHRLNIAPRLVAAISVLAIIVLFALLAYQGHFLQPGKTLATATSTTAPTPLPDIWQTVPDLRYVAPAVTTIKFAQSDIRTGYVCGNRDGAATTLKLGVTHDAGLTWKTSLLTGIPGKYCKIYVNPYDANDIALINGTCLGQCVTGSYTGEYRSRDGGKTWIPLVLPPGNEASGATLIDFPVWTPTAMFALTESPAGLATSPPAHALAVSVNGGPLAWIPRNPTTPTPTQLVNTRIFALGNSINFYTTGTSHDDLFTSTDNGVTWDHIIPQGPVPAVGSILTIESKHIVVGIHVADQGRSTQVVRSADGGRTWSSLASPQNSLQDGLAAAPDGSLFTIFSPKASQDGQVSGVPAGIYRLAPGATSWTLVVPLNTAETDLVAVSGESDGHPTIAWAFIGLSPSSPEFHPIR